MKKQVFCLLLIVVFALPMASLSFEDFDNLIMFHYGLEDIYEAVNVDDMEVINAAAEHFVILKGTVASRIVLDGNEESFVGQLELVGGEWDGVTSVSAYRGYVLLFGPEFYGTIPARRSRNANPDEIALNTEILIAGVLIDIVEGQDEWIPVFQGTHIRK